MNNLARPSRALVTQQDAALNERQDIPRSRFTGSWTHKTTFNAADLIPIYIMEIYPGDHIRMNVMAYIRMMTPQFPLMDNQRLDTFGFYCPSRILWANFVKMMGEQLNPSDSIAYTFPQIVSPAGGFAINSLFDHFGLPCVGQITAGQTITINALPPRMYNRVWNDWFRDQNLQSSQPILTGDGPDPNTSFPIMQRNKQHDRFTKALPWTQKFTAPTVPLTGLAPVIGLGIQLADRGASATNATFYESTGATRLYPFYKNTPSTLFTEYTANASAYPAIFAKLDNATGGVSINTLRNAWAIQQLLERDARGGTRYTEKVLQHFGVQSPDMRLQRPEYIGGGSTPLNITPIAQTTPTGGNGLGALGGAGVAAGTHSYSYAATEHGYLMILANIRTELSYQQGMNRLWSRSDQYSLYIPALAQLGEQAILNKEIYCVGGAAGGQDDGVFGYEPRWDDLRQEYNYVSGMFRSTSAGTIDGWHLAQKFTALPTLGGAFIADATNATMDRVLLAGAAAQNMQYLAIFHFERDATRPMPLYGTPANLSRF